MLLTLDRQSRISLRHQLEIAIRDGIRGGRLAPGSRLPASRDLAKQLGVSRGVVVDAYAMLHAQGFLLIRERSAPVVAPYLSPPAAEAGELDPVVDPPPRFDFTATTPDVALFNRRGWGRALDHVLRTAPDAAFDYGDERGVYEVRRALTEYLGRVRAVVADPTRIVMLQGYSQAIDLVCRMLAARGAKSIAFESPSHDEQWVTARSAGLEPVAMPVDRDGLRVDQLTGVDAVVVTPAHQFPTGGVLSAERRRRLLVWAAEHEALVIEDDYDSEFRYDGAPVGALQGLDPAHVLHVGTLSKTLVPTLRLGWALVPAGYLDDFSQAKLQADAGSPAIEQLAFARLLETGNYEREVQRMRNEYRSRRDSLLRELETALPDCRVLGIAAGLHVLVELPAGCEEQQVAAAAKARRVSVRALRDFKLQPDERPPSLVLGYGRLTEPAIPAAIGELAAAVRDVHPQI